MVLKKMKNNIKQENQQGWICNICGRSLNPQIKECPYCNYNLINIQEYNKWWNLYIKSLMFNASDKNN